MSAVLVGPLPTIWFQDGARQVYDRPRDTLDLRYVACIDHHPACDCREAMLAENEGEYRSQIQDDKEIFAHLLDAPCVPSERRRCELCRRALLNLGRFDAALGGA